MATIVNVAIRQDGVFFSPVHRVGWRHHHLIAELIRCRVPAPITGEQGFVTDEGRFVDRVEALAIANAAGQIIRRTGNPHSNELYSEDLW